MCDTTKTPCFYDSSTDSETTYDHGGPNVAQSNYFPTDSIRLYATRMTCPLLRRPRRPRPPNPPLQPCSAPLRGPPGVLSADMSASRCARTPIHAAPRHLPCPGPERPRPVPRPLPLLIPSTARDWRFPAPGPATGLPRVAKPPRGVAFCEDRPSFETCVLGTAQRFAPSPSQPSCDGRRTRLLSRQARRDEPESRASSPLGAVRCSTGCRE